MFVMVWKSLDEALKRLDRKVRQDGDLRRFRERAKGYLKPSVRERLKHRKAVTRLRDKERRQRSRQGIDRVLLDGGRHEVRKPATFGRV